LEEIQPNANDIAAPVLPIVLLMNLGVGATSLICNYNSKKPKKTDFKTLVDDLTRHKVNRMEASPDFVLRLGDYCLSNSIQLNHLERIYTGGAPVFPFQAKRLLNAFPSSRINVVYGSTEAEPISMINAIDLAHSKIQATDGLPVGQIYKGATVYIIPVSHKQVVIDSEEKLVQLKCKTGALGEIIVAGDHVLTKYFRNEEAILQNKIFINNKCYHRTGDSGYVDESGKLFLTGRCSGLIEYNGMLIKPFIYENALTEDGLCSIGTAILHKNKLLLVVEGNEINKSKIIASMKEKGFAFDDCVFVNEIPRDKRHHSKIDYSLLIEKLSGFLNKPL
jgi:acyl-CoA synthetase (AMP-forming)/AMP-acid ligase II